MRHKKCSAQHFQQIHRLMGSMKPKMKTHKKVKQQNKIKTERNIKWEVTENTRAQNSPLMLTTSGDQQFFFFHIPDSDQSISYFR